MVLHMDAPEKGGNNLARKRKERKDGRICVQFRYNGKRYSAYGDSTKEAESNAAQMKAQLMAGVYESVTDRRKREKEEREAIVIGSRMPTFEQYAREWLNHKMEINNIKGASVCTYNVLLNLICNAEIDSRRFGDLPLDQITRRDIRNLQKELSAKKVCSRTINNCVGKIRAIYKRAISDDELVSKNPANGIEPVGRTEARAVDTIHRALSKEETRLFFETAKKEHSRYCNLYTFLLHTGLRCGEAGALYTSDIAPDGIVVSRTITRTESGRYVVGVDAKTEAGRRFVPLDPEAREALRDQMSINAALQPEKVVPIHNRVFRAARSGVLNTAIIDGDIAKICEKAGIEKFTVHAFRDTFATRAAESGMEPKQLQSIIGHTDISTTMNYYVHADKDRKIEQLLAVNFT